MSMTAEEVLQAMALTEEDNFYVIDGETREITPPAGLSDLFGVETDKDVERKYFRCPKIVGDNIDLSQHEIYVSYMNGNGQYDLYPVEDMEVSGDNIEFSWLISDFATAYSGTINFAVCAKKPDESDPGKMITVWNTTAAQGRVEEGIPATNGVVEQNPDIIENILARLSELESSGGVAGVGISNIEKTGTQGLVDTYTIYLTDDRTYTFTVTNGANGKDGSSELTIQTMQNTDTTVTLPGETSYNLYIFPEMATLAVTIADENTDVHFFFDSGATATVFSLQSQDGGQIYTDAYSIDANMRYEVSVLHNVAYIKGVAISAET